MFIRANKVSTPHRKTYYFYLLITILINMNIYNTIQLNSKLDSILGKLNFKKDFKSHLLYIIFHIRTYPFKNRQYQDGDFIPIKVKYLRNLISYDYTIKFLKLLVEEGVLDCDEVYEIGSKSKGYRLTDKYRKGSFYLEKMWDSELSDKIKNKLGEITDEVLNRKDAYSYVTKCMQSLDMDYDKANTVLQNMSPNLRKKSKMMIDIFDTKFATIDDTANRLHNNLTNLSTSLRSTLSIKDKVLIQCDLKNSQPLLFRVYLNKYPYIPQEELDKYLDVVCNIGFYEFFADKLNIKLTEKNRMEFKKKIFGGVLFDKNRKNLSKYEKVFEKEFPIIFHCMRDMKSENYKDIPIALQKLESQYIFHCVDKLSKENKDIELLTIHDSIVTTEGKEQIVYNLMITEFQKMFDITPKIKIEKFA